MSKIAKDIDNMSFAIDEFDRVMNFREKNLTGDILEDAALNSATLKEIERIRDRFEKVKNEIHG